MSALVLIAGNQVKRLERVRRLVENEGAATITSSDPRETMRLLVRREPDLTRLQIHASDALGMELCRDMKTLGLGRRRSVVVIAPGGARSAALEAGCDAFVGRSTNNRLLLRMIRRFLDSHRQPQRTAATT
jgi:DNA-binding response OmpR family regulator